MSNICLLDSVHGVYIPQIFAFAQDMEKWGIADSTDDLKILREGPDNQYYWEAWEEILKNARYTDIDGTTYMLNHDMDLFAEKIE